MLLPNMNASTLGASKDSMAMGSSVRKSAAGLSVEQQQQAYQAQMNNTKKMHDIMVIDEICNIIRMSCQEQELVRLINQYQIEEAKIINMQ